MHPTNYPSHSISGENLAQDKHSMLCEYYGNVQLVSGRGAGEWRRWG